MPHLLAFIAVAAIVIATPGPDTALTVRNTLWRGRRSGRATALGVGIGQLIWAAAAVAGLASVLRAWQPGFTVLRLVGALYLAYLGAATLRNAWRADGGGGHSAAGSGPGGSLRQGLLSNLSNPKMGVFFLSLLPQFVAGHHTSPAELLGLGALFAAMTVGWLSTYSWVVDRVGDVLRRGRMRRLVDGISGTALMVLGLRVALE